MVSGLAVLCLSACGGEKVVVEHQIPVVTAQRVEMSIPTAGEERYSAIINPSSQMEVLFKGSGYVDYILKTRDKTGNLRIVQEGDAVRSGDVLARLRQNDNQEKIREQQASLREAQLSGAKVNAAIETVEAELKQAETEHARSSRLFALDSLTKPEMDAASTRLEVARSRLREAKAQIPVNYAIQDRLKASLQEVKIGSRDSVLICPMNGIVLKRNIEEGSLANNGTNAFTLADTPTVKAMFGLPDVKLGQVQQGMTIPVTTEAIPGRIFSGRVSDIGATADQKTRVFNVEISIPNGERELRPGMVASLVLGAPAISGPQVTIPFSAVIRSTKDPQAYSVYAVKDEGGKLVAIETGVKLGEPTGRMVTVLEGLTQTDRVVTNGSSRIASGQEVRVLE